MPNWTNISLDDLKASGHGLIVDRAQTLATGGVDPVTDAIDNAVARVRRAVQAGNALDTVATKVPRSLKAVTVRLVLFALMERIGLPLSEDQRKTRENDNSDLLRIADRKVRIEPADNPNTDEAGPINPGTWNSERKIVGRMHPVPAPAAQHAPAGGYANPNAPEDSAQ
jgi:hypothetical protein